MKARACSKCGATKNLCKAGAICKACKAKRDQRYNPQRLEQQRLKRLENPPLMVPTVRGACDMDFDPEVCPKRRKQARRAAALRHHVEIVACLSCEIIAPEAQPAPLQLCRRCGSPELLPSRRICKDCFREDQKSYRLAK